MISLRAPRAPERRPLLASQAGLTLTELMLVGALAIIVMLGLTGFYFNSQRMWLSGSTQAMTQRDASLLLDVIGKAVHEADSAVVTMSDPNHHVLELFVLNTPVARFETDDVDGRVHRYVDADDQGSVVESKCSRLQFNTIDSTLVELTLAELVTAQEDTVRIASRFQLLGRR